MSGGVGTRRGHKARAPQAPRSRGRQWNGVPLLSPAHPPQAHSSSGQLPASPEDRAGPAAHGHSTRSPRLRKPRVAHVTPHGRCWPAGVERASGAGTSVLPRSALLSWLFSKWVTEGVGTEAQDWECEPPPRTAVDPASVLGSHERLQAQVWKCLVPGENLAALRIAKEPGGEGPAPVTTPRTCVVPRSSYCATGWPLSSPLGHHPSHSRPGLCPSYLLALRGRQRNKAGHSPCWHMWAVA